jgi:hypothetical protein
MTDLDLSQAEANSLIQMPKERASEQRWESPGLQDAIPVPLSFLDRRVSPRPPAALLCGWRSHSRQRTLDIEWFLFR